MRSGSSAVVSAALLMAFVGLIAFSLPAAATATDTHFYVGGDALCLSNEWIDSNCWSHTSGGSPAAGAPTLTNDVVFDSLGGPAVVPVGGNGVSRDIVVSDNADAQAINIGTGNTLTFRSLVITGTHSGGFGLVISGSGGTISFSGSLTGSPSDPAFFDAVIGPGIITYTGANGFATASYMEFENMDASGGPAIYCFPGCTDGGGNTNILFEAPPTTPTAPPACAINEGIPGLTGILILIVGVGILGMILTPFIAYKTGKEFTYHEYVAPLVTVIVVLLVATVLISNLSC